MELRKLLIVFSLIGLLAACQSGPPAGVRVADVPDAAPPRHAVMYSGPRLEIKRKPPVDLWDRIRRELTWQSIHNSQVAQARDHFLKQHDYLDVIAERAALYLYYIVEEVERRDLPMEIALLPLVESTLNPFAYSSSRAAGLWQIMPATGRYLGLQRDWWYDGRRDLRQSTRAALDYLEGLHEAFDDDWLLALAAYNSGKGRVRRAQEQNRNKGLGTDYWSLKLPRETRYYVPKLVALAQIIAYPDAFRVEIPTVANAPAFDIGDTGGQIELARAADLAGVELSTLRALNAGHLRWATSPDRPPELLIPVGVGDRFSEGIAALGEEDRVTWQYYKIQRGDNLIRIAGKFDTDVGLLRQANNIRGSMIRAGDTLMIPKGSAWYDSLAMVDDQPARPTGYRVRSGDSLYRIADKFNVTVNDIVSWNSLDPAAYLQPGQKLTLYVRDS
jgi:membrane-bound lytic murein transglycosylase D